MPQSETSHRRTGRWIVPTLAFAVLSILACVTSTGPAVSQAKPTAQSASYSTANTRPIDRTVTSHDPIALLEQALIRCDRDIRDYECVFERQERINGELLPTQRVKVAYNDDPRTVHMVWLEDNGQVRQAWYADGENLSDEGETQVVIEPAGKVLRALAPPIELDPNGDIALRTSRFGINQFGFRVTLERILDGVHRFGADGVMQIAYVGEGQIDDRPTHVIVRRLPYTGPDSPYPEAKLIVHLDQEWLVPVAIYCYADAGEQELIGRYVTTQIKLNTGWRAKSNGI